ncbi:MAG: hypothetical protein CMH64_00470 [Nanoarchaeota archaeon]|nr:hypothetical protein [Nanoarchaeota archaeon]|tara:strand:- start:1228 stop:1455 length:228 start_codon:yes stop_codon:yes gene_type:complete
MFNYVAYEEIRPYFGNWVNLTHPRNGMALEHSILVYADDVRRGTKEFGGIIEGFILDMEEKWHPFYSNSLIEVID